MRIKTIKKKAAWYIRPFFDIFYFRILSILTIAIIIVAVLLVILEALESYLNYQKKWMNYRTTAEGLRREEQMFKTRTDEYEGVGDPEKVFVERVMALTSQENRYWEITTRKAQEA
jgi:cytochrome c biogenesis protein ResB